MVFRLTLFPLLLLTAAFQSPPDSMRRHYQAAQEFQRAGKLDQAAAEYGAALGEAYANLGKVLLAEESYQKAVIAFDRAVTNQTASEALLLDQATAYFYAQQYQQAIAPLQKVLATDGRSPAAHHLLGKVYFMLRQFDKSASELELALKSAPTDFDLGYTLALAYLKQNQLAPAQQIFSRLLRSMGNRPEVHNLFGRAYRETNFPDAAIEEFKKTIALDPKYPRAHYHLGLTYLIKDNTLKLKEAAAEFKTELAAYPEEFLAIYNLGLVYVVDRQYQEAATLLEKATRLRPQNSDAFLFLGNAYHGLGQYEKAVAALQKSIALNPDLDKTSSFAAEAHFLLGKSLVQVGRVEEGQKELQAAGKLKAQALTSDREKLDSYMKAEAYKGAQLPQEDKDAFAAKVDAADPKLKAKLQDSETYYRQIVAQIHNQLGLLEADQQKFHAATDQFRAAAEWDSNLRDIYYNFGLAAYKAELYQAAIPPLELETKTNPANLSAKHLLGMCYFLVDDYPKAADTLNEVLPSRPTNVGLYYMLSVSLIKQGNVQAADQVIQKMLTMCGDSAQVHILLGQAYYAREDTANALAELKKALEMDAKASMAHYYTGLIYIKMGKFDEAAPELEAELVANPKDYEARYNLGFVLLSRGEVERGAKLMREVIAFKPTFADAWFELGKALLQQGNVKGAIESLEAAVKLGPEKPHIHYQLGRAYIAAGREADGQKQLEIYKQIKDKERNRTNP